MIWVTTMPIADTAMVPMAMYVMRPPLGRRKMNTMESEDSAIGTIVMMLPMPFCFSGRPGGSWSWISPSGISGPGRLGGRLTCTTLNEQRSSHLAADCVPIPRQSGTGGRCPMVQPRGPCPG